MQKNLFKKYLRVSLTIVLISFLMLGIMLLVFISRYWQSEKRDLLSKNAQSIAALAASNIDSYTMKGVVTTVSVSSDADIFITDVAGNTIISSDTGVRFAGRQIPELIMSMAMKSEDGYAGTSNLGGIYDSPYYVVGVPVIVNDSSEKTVVVAVVFTASDAKYLSRFRSDVLKMFFFASIAAFAISFCAVGLFSYSMVRPLRAMAVAAHCFGEGDFSRRVPVTSQDEIGQLAVAFNNMATSLSSSESVRRSFIANVSHELKTPMTTIAGFIDGILDGTIPQEKQNYYLKIVSDEVKRLSRLVRTMLDLSRIDSGELHMRKQRFDLTNTVLTALLTFENSIEKREIEIRGLEDAQALFIDGDPDMIHQVVYNLIENAVKFVDQGGYIELKISDSTDRAVVTIKNSGQGIPKDEVSLIFDKFYKTDKSRSQDKNGMGLGLYIVRTMVRLHGGDITVSSVEGEFCQFTFWLPKTTANELAKGKE